MGLLELQVCDDRWSKMPFFVEVKKLKLDGWGLHFVQTAVCDITKVQ